MKKQQNETRFTQKEPVQKYSTFADDQVIIADSQDNLQRVFALKNIAKKKNFEWKYQKYLRR